MKNALFGSVLLIASLLAFRAEREGRRPYERVGERFSRMHTDDGIPIGDPHGRTQPRTIPVRARALRCAPADVEDPAARRSRSDGQRRR